MAVRVPATLVALVLALALVATPVLLAPTASAAPPCIAGHEDRCWIQFVVCVTDPCPPRYGGPLEPLNDL